MLFIQKMRSLKCSIFVACTKCFLMIQNVYAVWFKSYLENRFQYVELNGEKSAKLPLLTGVPQGSILGPLIFLIFNIDFPASSIEGSSVLYADDNTDNVHDKNVADLEAKIQCEADKSTDWVKDN